MLCDVSPNMLSNILNRYLKERYLLSIVVSQWLVTAIKVCLRHMCLVFLRPARPSHQSLYKCLHHQWCHRLRFLFLRINYPHDLQCLLILLRCSDGLSTDSTGGWSICDTSDNRLAELEVCGKKISGDWWSSTDGYSATPGLRQDSLKAPGKQQEG